MIKSIAKILLLAALVSTAHAQSTDLASTVSQVTLYSDRATVTRSAEGTLPAGTSTVILRGIPHGISADSITATGSGPKGTSIIGVELKSVPLREDVSKEIQALRDKLDLLTRERESINRRREMLNRQLTLVTSLNLDAQVPAEGDKLSRPRTPKEMLEILNLISETEQKLDPEFRAVEESGKKNSREIDLVNKQLSNLQPQRRSETVIEIGITVPQGGKVNLQVQYQVSGASWTPSYNLNVSDTADSAVLLETFAVITQRTGEDWRNVELTLSTARPQVALERPDPQPFYLDVLRPEPVPLAARAAAANLSLKRSTEGAAEQADLAMAPLAAGSSDSEQEEILQQGAVINYGALVEYKTTDRVTLPSDGSTQKIFLQRSNLTAKMYFIAVPSLYQEVFKEAELTNTTSATLLAGPVSIFNDGQFVGQRDLELTQPNQKFRLPLGLAQKLQVTRNLAKRYEDDSGIIRQVRRIKDEYQIELTNNSTAKADIIVLEPIPVSRNEAITVALSDQKPQPMAASDKNRILNSDGVLEWQIGVPPESKSMINYSTTIEFPAKMKVTGMPN